MNDMEGLITTQTESYLLCKRLYHKCQAIIFSETDSSPQDITALILTDIQKSAHVPPAIVAMGVVLGAVGGVSNMESVESIVSIEAKKPRFFNPFNDNDSYFAQSAESAAELSNIKEEITQEEMIEIERRKGLLDKIFFRIPTNSPSLDELSKGSAFSFRNFLKKTGVIANSKIRPEKSSPTTPALETRFDASKHKPLERSHYFHAEIQFIMTLVDISERLVSMPKPARQASLIAELTLLNHNLPANVCLPFWCPAVAKYQKHHQIVRLSLSDCVVLNSADRVPYLMVVEVIETASGAARRASFPGASMESIPMDPLASTPTLRRPSLAKLGINDGTLNKDSAEYHQKVISRRRSAAGRNSADGVRSESEISLFDSKPPSLKARVSENDISNIPPPLEIVENLDLVNSPIRISSGNENHFSDRMRTAAVLLAQLYQQQQKEMDSTSKPRSRSSSVSTINTFPESAKASSSTAQPPQIKDKRTQNKRKTEFETIRIRVLEEMAASESERLKTMHDKKPAAGEQQVDELLPESQEIELQRDNEDPSGIPANLTNSFGVSRTMGGKEEPD